MKGGVIQALEVLETIKEARIKQDSNVVKQEKVDIEEQVNVQENKPKQVININSNHNNTNIQNNNKIKNIVNNVAPNQNSNKNLNIVNRNLVSSSGKNKEMPINFINNTSNADNKTRGIINKKPINIIPINRTELKSGGKSNSPQSKPINNLIQSNNNNQYINKMNMSPQNYGGNKLFGNINTNQNNNNLMSKNVNSNILKNSTKK